MYKFFFAVLLTLISSQAFAGWTSTPFAAGHDGTYYWDVEQIKYKGNSLKIWIGTDFGEPQVSRLKPGANFLSLKEKMEVNCATSRSRTIEYVELSDHLGSGTVIIRNMRKTQWTAIEPDFLSYNVMTTFCKKTSQ